MAPAPATRDAGGLSGACNLALAKVGMPKQSLHVVHKCDNDVPAVQKSRLEYGGPASCRPEREWLDLKAVTEYVSISDRTLREWLHRPINPLPAVRVGTKILVRRTILDKWLEAHPLTPADSVDVDSAVRTILKDLEVA